MALEGKQFSHYRVLQLIGRGGMGEVYLVEDVQVQRQVAAKIIRIETVQPGQESVARLLRLFWREATAIARLDHPNILPLYDYGEITIDEFQVAYLIIPYRPEGSLVTWLRQRAPTKQTRQLMLKQVAHVIQQAGQALQYAHDQQVMHLDVKPANFLIRSRSEADDYPDLLLCDFGIARLSGANSNASQHVSGTPTYMAPEQWANRPVFASDQYALAAMAYELLAGRPPFQGAPMNMMYFHLQEQPQAVRDHNPQLPLAVDFVLQRALAKKPEERFPSVVAFTHAFQEAIQGGDESTVLSDMPFSAVMQRTTGTPPSAGDIRANLSISAQEAHSGAERTLTLPNGRSVNVQIPPGAQSGQVLIMIGQGEPLGPGAMAGNLYLSLSVLEAPVQLSLASDDSTSTVRAHQPAQSLPFAPDATAPQEKVTSPHGLGSLSPLAAIQTDFPLQGSVPLSSSPKPAQPKRRRSSAVVVGLILLTLMILGGGSIGVYGATTGQWPWNTSRRLSTSTLPGKSTQATANATAQAKIGVTGWHAQTSGTTQSLNGVARSDSQFVVVGNKGIILTSPDGRHWTARPSGTSHSFSGITWSGSQFVAVGDMGTIRTSPDGGHWIARPSGTSQKLWIVAWAGSQFVAVGDKGTILTSPDGEHWTARSSGTMQALWSVAWAGSQFVAVGDKGAILTSPDGEYWTAHSSGTTQPLNGVAWSGSQCVAVGKNGTILTSPDGNYWTAHKSGTSELWIVAWTGSQFVTMGKNGTILTSPDGNYWTAHKSGTSQLLSDVSWSSSLFVAVGDKGTILTSP